MKKIVKALIEEEIKNKAEEVFKINGIKTSEAIRLFFFYVSNKGKIPIELNQMGEQTFFLSRISK